MVTLISRPILSLFSTLEVSRLRSNITYYFLLSCFLCGSLSVEGCFTSF